MMGSVAASVCRALPVGPATVGSALTPHHSTRSRQRWGMREPLVWGWLRTRRSGSCSALSIPGLKVALALQLLLPLLFEALSSFFLAPKDRAWGVFFAHSLPPAPASACSLLFVTASAPGPFLFSQVIRRSGSPCRHQPLCHGSCPFSLSQLSLLMRLGREAPPKVSSDLSHELTASVSYGHSSFCDTSASASQWLTHGDWLWAVQPPLLSGALLSWLAAPSSGCGEERKGGQGFIALC